MATSKAFFQKSGADFFGYNGRKNTIRPDSPDSVSSDDSIKLTKHQHDCINNLGMAAAFFLPIALIAGAVGFGTTYWFNIPPYYVGLFKRCNNWTVVCDSVKNFYSDGKTDVYSVKTTWTIGVPLLLLGGAILVIAFATMVCYPCHRKVNFGKMACAVTVGIILLLGFIAFLSGFAMFSYYAGTTQAAKPMWSFYIAATAAGFAFLSALLFWVHIFYTGCFDKD